MDITTLLTHINNNWYTKAGKLSNNKACSKTNAQYYLTLLDLTNFLPQSSGIGERVYCLSMNITSVPLCNCCNTPVVFDSSRRTYPLYCSNHCRKLSYEEIHKKQQQTMLDKYGVKHPMQIKEVQQKIKNVVLDKYGVEHASQSDIVKQKTKETNLAKYGVEYANQSDVVRQKIQQTNTERYGGKSSLCSPDIKRKIKNTNVERFGFVNPLNNKQIREKQQQTMMDRYGVKHPIQNSEIKASIQTTNLERYGSISCFGNEKIIEKNKNTMMSKFGVDNPSKSANLQDNKRLNYQTGFGVDHHSQRHFSNETYKLLRNKDWLTEQHHDLKLPLSFIAKKLGVSPHAVERRFKLYKIDVKYYYTSSQHIEIVEFIRSVYERSIIENTRTVIPPHEIDIYLPDIGVAIEVNGVYWHSELNGKDKYYHLSKTKQTHLQNIKLFQIWDIEWKKQRNIVESRIKSALGLNKKIYARKCDIRPVDNILEQTFLKQNHIQGYVASSYKVGLFYENNIVALMTFGKSRFSKQTEWELLRYCSLTGVNVIGGPSKLFANFLKTKKPKNVISYCDMRYGTGNMYEQLGFNQINWSLPNYKYFSINNPHGLSSRIQFQKHKLAHKLTTFDKALTEWENMKNNGYDRIWDCGNTVWVFNQVVESKT